MFSSRPTYFFPKKTQDFQDYHPDLSICPFIGLKISFYSDFLVSFISKSFSLTHFHKTLDFFTSQPDLARDLFAVNDPIFKKNHPNLTLRPHFPISHRNFPFFQWETSVPSQVPFQLSLPKIIPNSPFQQNQQLQFPREKLRI